MLASAHVRAVLLVATLAATLASAINYRHEDGEKVEVAVFYETMCPYCHRFLNTTLKPFWEDPSMRSLVDLKLLPAGNVMVVKAAEASKGYHFWHPELAGREYFYRCQHGESECLGNMIHACAIKLLPQEKYLPLVFCMAAETQAVPEKSSIECMDQLSISPEPIRDCVFAPKADEEMFAIASFDARLKTPRTYVPWITVNGDHLEVNNGTAVLREAVCKALGEAAPPASCSEPKLMQVGPSAAGLALSTSGRAGPAPSSTATGACYPGEPRQL